MMQAADSWHRDHFALLTQLDLARVRRVAIEGKMCSILVVVREVARENPSQVGFVENDDMFEALSANGTDDSLVIGTQLGCP